MAINHFGVLEYCIYLGLCFVAVFVSIILSKMIHGWLSEEEKEKVETRSGYLFEAISLTSTVAIPGGYWFLSRFAPQFFDARLWQIIIATFLALTILMIIASVSQFRACRDSAPWWYFACITASKALGWGGIIAMITLVAMVTRPLPGEEGAADSFPDYKVEVSNTLRENYPGQSIQIVLQFGDNDLKVLTVIIDGRNVPVNHDNFQKLEQDILAVRISSRLKRISKKVIISVAPQN